MNSRVEVEGTSEATPGLAGEISPRDHWSSWRAALRGHQLDGVAGWLLDAGRPLALLSAQLLYLGRPLLGASIDAMARLLESDDEVTAFANYLESDIEVGRMVTGGNP